MKLLLLLILAKTIQIHSLDILMKYFYCQSFGWFSNKISIMTNNFFSYNTLLAGYHINYLKYTNNITAQYFRYLLFYMKVDRIYILLFLV